MLPSAAKPVRPEDSVGGARELEHILLRFIGKTYTVTIVRVNNVQAGAAGPVGYLDATDMIQQMNGSNEGIPNVQMKSMPYFRLQGGGSAVIMDPKPGDLGIALFAQRDITQLKRSKTEGPPPSLRTHDVSDGLYIGGLLNGAPQQWIQFLDTGINIKSTGDVTIDAALLQVNCPIVSTGNITDHTSSMQDMRSQYNGHTHPGGGAPEPQMT